MKNSSKFVLVAAAVATLVLAGPAAAQSSVELPPNAKPGECYARVFVPAAYDTVTEQVLMQESSERIDIVPARYEWVEERVMVKEAGQRLEQIPARHEWVEEKVMVTPARTVWKKGRGPIERVDNGTGEIMCLVEEPASYRTVRKQVLKSPASTRTVEIPAEYKTVRVQKLVSPPTERRTEIPAKYETVTKKSLRSDGRVEWRPILCQTNLSGTTVTQIQRALSNAGHNPGPIDGVIGQQTVTALKSFQRSKGLPEGALTMNTLRALNVNVGG